MTTDIVDGYCHCGLGKYRPIADVGRFMDRVGISRSVLVQHIGEYDNTYIEGIVAEHPNRYVGVMLVDVEGQAPTNAMSRWAQKGILRGVRLIARTLQSHPEVWEHAADLGLRIVVYDQPTIATSVGDLAKFARLHEHTRLVISHLGVLDSRESPSFDSHRHILTLADQPNILIQLSGFDMFARFPYTELVPLVEQLVESFGVRRCLFGTNYPVPEDDGVHVGELELIQTGKLGVPGEAIHQVLYDTALDLWFKHAQNM